MLSEGEKEADGDNVVTIRKSGPSGQGAEDSSKLLN
jgi:hypothetical protein